MKTTGKLVAIALLASIAMFAVSCGGNAKKKAADGATETATETKATPAKGGAVALKDVNESNWQAAVKSNFGLDVPVPDGWSFKSVESPNGRTNLKLFLNIGGATTGEAMGKQLFEATKALSSHGNYTGVPDWDNDKVLAGAAVSDISEVDKSSGPNVIAQWCFTTGSKSVMVSYYWMGGNEAEYTFTINSTKG
jgi:hypothetical protein